MAVKGRVGAEDLVIPARLGEQHQPHVLDALTLACGNREEDHLRNAAVILTLKMGDRVRAFSFGRGRMKHDALDTCIFDREAGRRRPTTRSERDGGDMALAYRPEREEKSDTSTRQVRSIRMRDNAGI